jgi:hypothetical protein
MKTDINKGYFNSHWPVECGGNRRQKIFNGSLNIKEKSHHLITKVNNRWNVMFISRDDNELYLAGTMPNFIGEKPFGWVQKVNPYNLETICESPNLECGEHIWCGAIAAHANGTIINVNGSYMHILDENCNVLKEIKLPIDQAHNGLLILSDGSIVTKDIRVSNNTTSTLTRLNPESGELIGEPLILPEGSMGRIACDIDDSGEYIYIPGIEHIFKIRVEKDQLVMEKNWSVKYREINSDYGLAWDGCISDGFIWLMNNGDIESVRSIFSRYPNGRFSSAPGTLSWQRPALWKGNQQLLKVSIDNQTIDYVTLSNKPGGGIIAPPVSIPKYNLCIAWDSLNGGLFAVNQENLNIEWTVNIRPTMQPVVFLDSGELIINSYENNSDHIVVINLESGELIEKIDLKSPLANGMFLTPGIKNDIYYCSTLTIAKIHWN